MEPISHRSRGRPAVLKPEVHFHAASDQAIPGRQPAGEREALMDRMTFRDLQNGDDLALASGDGKRLVPHQAVNGDILSVFPLPYLAPLEHIPRAGEPAGSGEHLKGAGHLLAVREDGLGVEMDELSAVNLQRREIGSQHGEHLDADLMALDVRAEDFRSKILRREGSHGLPLSRCSATPHPCGAGVGYSVGEPLCRLPIRGRPPRIAPTRDA
jgi:hypothetical protein